MSGLFVNGFLKVILDIAGRGRVTSELSIEDVNKLARTGGYLNVTCDVAEARRQVVRSRLAELTDLGEGHLVLADPAFGEWVIPARSVLSATFMEPGAKQEHRIGFGAPKIR